MNPLKLLLLLTSLAILFSCREEPVPKPLPEAGYPKTYIPLSASAWNQRNSEFQEINIYEGLSLNKYGFVEGIFPFSENDSLTEEFVVNKLDSIITRYKSFLGIIANINIENDFRINIPMGVGGISSGSIARYFEDLNFYKQVEYWPEIKDAFTIQRYYITQNKIDNKSFLGPTLNFTFDERNKTIQISGKWLPNAYLPQNEIYTLDDAITKTYWFVLKETGIDVWESKNTIGTTKIFIFLEKENVITIHECWRCMVPLQGHGYYYYISIDTQSGEIIHTYKRGMYYI